MAMITNDWLPALQEEFKKPYYRTLYQFVREEYAKTTIYPPADDIFNALHLTPLSQVKVLILGQDPYHNAGQAHGLCFSVKPVCIRAVFSADYKNSIYFFAQICQTVLPVVGCRADSAQNL